MHGENTKTPNSLAMKKLITVICQAIPWFAIIFIQELNHSRLNKLIATVEGEPGGRA